MTPQDTTLLAAAVVESQDGYAQAIRTGKHHFQSDEPSSLGGTDQGPAPYQLLMGSLGACTAITLKMYAARKGWDLGPLTVKLKLFREKDHTERVERVLSCGPSVSEEQRARLLDIAAKTPVTLTLSRALRIETTFAPPSP
ncbi:OsmC family protein [Myxococcus landrumensis]|uniref:OsmC family protein n=1 Tax=Myxococcus landrumensis TaxID=2813577 RepID=A0ABX7N321_9BACT|nr:OsmC family protein [Myxococcus landrumus]QSQ13023.1 OsmC family protein [Myxococcus landrumus]